jgi:hypothetical protein
VAGHRKGSPMSAVRLSSVLALVSCVLVAACGGGDTGGSSNPTSPSNSGSGSVSFFVSFVAPPDGSYTAQLNGQTYSSSGAFTVNLSPGTYTIEGSHRGTAFAVGFRSLVQGGVQSGSVRSLAGTAPQTTACGVTYGTANVSTAFRVQFTVTSSTTNACQ